MPKINKKQRKWNADKEIMRRLSKNKKELTNQFFDNWKKTGSGNIF